MFRYCTVSYQHKEGLHCYVRDKDELQCVVICSLQSSCWGVWSVQLILFEGTSNVYVG